MTQLEVRSDGRLFGTTRLPKGVFYSWEAELLDVSKLAPENVFELSIAAPSDQDLSNQMPWLRVYFQPFKGPLKGADVVPFTSLL